MAKFNHDLPHGEILGTGAKGAYWQAPNTFDRDFNHINPETGEIIERAEGQNAPPLKTKGKKETPAEKKARQQKQLNNPNTAANVQTVGVVEAPKGAGGIDLAAWARGELKNVQFFSVKKQMADEGYDPVPTTAIECREAIKAKN